MSVESSLPAKREMRRYRDADVVDAVVIGTGAGGAPLTTRLAAAGLSVVALEAGHEFSPQSDFATDEREQSKLFWNDERLSAGEDPVHFGRNNSGCAVGGSTLHYTAFVPRPHRDDFRFYTLTGMGADWPFGYDALEPYYDELEQVLGVSGPSPYPWDAGRKPYPLPPLPLNAAAELMQRGCRALGIRTAPAPNAALSRPYFTPEFGWRAACTNRGFCQAGCSVGSKGSMDVTFIPRAVQLGAEVRAGSFATRIEVGSDDRVREVIYTAGGEVRRQRCRTLFLCGGAIESPRLLLMSGVANSSGRVGRNFLVHLGLQVWGTFDEWTQPFKGIPASLISEDTRRNDGVDFAGGFLLQSIGVMPVTYASQVTRARGLWGSALREHMRSYNNVAGIDMHGEQIPSEENRVELSSEIDARGLPKPVVFHTFGENDRRMMAFGEKLMREIWNRAGATESWPFTRTAHTLGTCSMGVNPATSVVDGNGRAHDVPNLYVADASVFPTSLCANPALTVMAVSLRTADAFLDQLRRREA